MRGGGDHRQWHGRRRLGIEAAARQHRLDFVPLATERYFIAARATTLATAAFRSVLESLRSPGFRELLNALPGYDAPEIGRFSLRATRCAPTRARFYAPVIARRSHALAPSTTTTSSSIAMITVSACC